MHLEPKRTRDRQAFFFDRAVCLLFLTVNVYLFDRSMNHILYSRGRCFARRKLLAP
jgi:hypothetical protein